MTGSILNAAANNPTGLGITDQCIKPKALTIPLAFATTPNILVDLTMLQQQKQIEFVQTMFIRTGADAVTITVQETNQVITIPANSCAFIPLIAPLLNPKLECVSANTNVILILMNYYVGPCVWLHT